jgi:glycosyltransferase A (GT-A) superfamily protein (DUF2064 family)
MASDCIVIIANDPESSHDLAALEHYLGKRKAAYLGRSIFFDTLALCLGLDEIDTIICYHPDSSLQHYQKMISLFAREEKDAEIISGISALQFYPRVSDSMIEGIADAFDSMFSRGYQRVLMIGSYCAALTPGLLKAGFLLLEKNDVAIGPTFGGRYYLFGLSQLLPGIFEGVHWESNDFYVRLGENLKKAGAKTRELEISYEVYTPDELNQLIVDIGCWRNVGDSRTACHTERFLRTLS